MGYDIVGDIHGHADKLEALLSRMGYEDIQGVWTHPHRRAIFVGDFIDRGPHQLRTVTTVRRMVEAQTALAVMGNHEFNAIAWHTPHPSRSGDSLRTRRHPTRGPRNLHQHRRFLEEVEDDPLLHKELIDWFMTLPLWIELAEIRVVHACWQQPLMDWLKPYLSPQHQLQPEILEAATHEPADEVEKNYAIPSIFTAIEALTKGIEVPLPPPHTTWTRMAVSGAGCACAGGIARPPAMPRRPTSMTSCARNSPGSPYRSTRGCS